MEKTKTTFSQLLKLATKRLSTAGCDSPALDARLLLQAVSGLDRSQLLMRENECPAVEVQEKYSSYIDRREGREPVYRILGAREFHGLSLKLGSDTLEPRDDTECLIEATLAQIVEKSAPLEFVDLGTGSGAVALALLSELPNAKVVATDISDDTLSIALGNAKALGFDGRLNAVQGSWLEPVIGQFDFIVSNPPYIESKVVDELAPEVLKFDPRAALDGGDDGLDAYREILQNADGYLKDDGFLALEIGHDQLQSVSRLGVSNGWKVYDQGKDLSGNDRALVFKR